MRKKLLIVLGVLAAIVVGFLIIVALQPNEFRVERSATIAAPAAVVFDQVNDFHKWDAWSPWAKLDLNAKNSFEGPSSGEGAIFKWSGNDKVGEGKMTLLESHPHDLVRIKLEFVRPMEDTSTTEFTFQPEGGETRVKWSMFGQQNFMGKAFCMFMNMDKMISADFEKGLASLKAASETAAVEK